MARIVGGVWGPTILSKYSRSDFSGMDRIVKLSVKLIGLTLALPIGFISGLAKPFLKVWLGSEYQTMAWVLIVLVFHLSVNLITSPFYNIQLTLNKLMVPALVKVSLGLLNFYLAINLSRKYGPIGIATAGALIITLENLFIWPIYTAKIMNFPWSRYMINLFPIILATLGVSIASYSIGLIIPPVSLINLFIIGVLVSCGYLVVSFLFGLTKEEKQMGLNILRNFMKVGA